MASRSCSALINAGAGVMRGLPAALALSLALTIALEVVFALAAGKRGQRDLLLVVLVNALTNPVVVLSYWLSVFYTGWSPPVVKGVLEVWAVGTEALCYKKYGRDFRHPLLFSILANAFSFGMGLLLQKLI